MDIIAAPVSEKMFWIDGETSLKQDGTAFQDILMAEASDTQTLELTENQKTPISAPVTEDSEEIEGETEKTEDSEPVPIIVKEGSTAILQDAKKAATNSVEAADEQIEPSPLLAEAPFENINVADPEPVVGRTYKAKGGLSAPDSGIAEKEGITARPVKANSTPLKEIEKDTPSKQLNPEMSPPATEYPKKIADLSPYPARDSSEKFTPRKNEQVVPVVRNNTKPLIEDSTLKSPLSAHPTTETDEVNVASERVLKESSTETPGQTVNTKKELPLVQKTSSDGPAVISKESGPSSEKAVPDYPQIVKEQPDIAGKVSENNPGGKGNSLDIRQTFPYENDVKKESVSGGSSNSREFVSRSRQISDLSRNPSERDFPAKTPSLPVQGERNEQVNPAGAIKGGDLYEAADLPLKEIQGIFQQKNVPSGRKNEKAGEANEKYSLLSDPEEEAPKNEYKTLQTSQTEGSLKEDFSAQKLRLQPRILNETLESARENNIKSNHTEIPDEGLSTEELNGEKRFQSLVNGEKRDAETSQATRKETAGYLFRKIESFIKTGKNEFSLKLYPEALGALQVKIRSNGDLLNIHMTAQSHLSKSVIESTLIELKASLAEQGFQADQLSVSVGKDGSFSSTGDSNMNNGTSERPHSRFPARTEDDLSGNETTAPGKKRKIAPGFSNVNIFA